MAVNLRATATLNTKPFVAGIKTIKAATESLNKSAVKGTTAVTTGVLAEKAAREASSKAVRQNQQAVTTATAASSKAMRQAATNTDAYKKSLAEVQGQSRKIIDSYAEMTPAMARHSKAIMDLSRAQVALATQQASGLEGPALQRYQTAVDNAARAVGRARASIIADNEKVAASTKKAAEAQTARNAVTTKGIEDAKAYTQGLSGLTNEKLKLQAASERLAASEARLASAMVKSNGVITPAVQTARAGVISATAAYNALAEAQGNIGKTGNQAASGLAAQRYLYHDVSRQAFGLGVALAAVPAAAIAVGAVWENQFANVIRTADPDVRNSTTRIDALRTSMIGMAKTMPLSFGAITEIATLGNQMGVQAQELEGFTKSVAMFSATSGIAVEEAATAFGRLRTVASDANFSFMGVADSILKVGVNSVATEQEIINVTTQISSIAASAGFSTQEMIGLSGALASVRVPPELSRSIITRTFGQFDKAIQKNGTELQTLARVSGRSVEDIKKNWGGPGAADIFVDFTNGLRKSGRAARMELEALGITSVRDVPALMRLANAADSNGVKGGLLAQTMHDARNAAGEVQGQYAIMAETVVGRLKVLGNSVLSFFNTLGSSSNGFVKSAIDGLTNMFQFMEKIVDNPFSSWALGAMAAMSGIALATSALAKLTAGVKMFQHVSSVVGTASFFNAIGMTKKGAGAGGAIAEMSPMLAGTASLFNSFKTGVKSAGATWRNFGNTIASTASWVVAERHIKNTGLGFRTLGDSIKAGSREVPKATGVLGNLVRFGLHPVTLGLGAVAAVGAYAYTSWADGFYKATTTTEQLASSLSKVDMSNMGEVSKVLKTINIDGRDIHRWSSSGVTPFKGGMPELIGNIKLLGDYQAEMAKVDEMHSRYKKNIRSGIERRYQAQGLDGRATEAGLGKLDDAFKEMRAAGNDAGVMSFWRQINEGAGTAAQKAERMKSVLDKMPNEAAALTNQFAMQDMSLEQGLRNFSKLSREMRDVAAEFDGTSIIADSFGLSDQEAAIFGKVLNEAASAFIDFNAALEAGTKTDDNGVFTGFDLSDFNKSLNDSMKAQGQWMNSMRYLATKTAPDIIEAMAEMGPAGLELGKSLVDGLESADPAIRAQAKKTLKTFEEAVYASKIDFGPNLAEYSNVMEKAGAMLGRKAGVGLNAKLAASLQPEDWSALSSGINAVIDKHGPELGGRLGERLFENLEAGKINVDQFSTLGEAFGVIGYNASKSIMDAIDRGISMDQITARIERIQAPKIPVEIEADSKAAGKITQAFKDMFGANGVEIPANFSLDSTMGDLREALKLTGEDGQGKLLPDIEANLTLNEIIAQGQLDGFRAWALAQGIDVEILANPMAAQLTLDAYTAVANRTVAMTQLDSVDMATGKLYDFVTTASGTTAIVEIDGDTKIATGKVWELDASVKAAKAKPIDADTDKAEAAIKEVNAKAEEAKTKSIEVTDNGTAADVQEKIDGITGKSVTVTVNEVRGTKVKMANGGVIQYYADGGVRENHIAQIAPAGTMRVWAEPETGGEAYIPLAPSKRVRSEQILNEVASRFGYSLVRGADAASYANGGMYNSQQLLRSFRRTTEVQTGTTKVLDVGGVSITTDNPTDSLREFSREVKKLTRGL